MSDEASLIRILVADDHPIVREGVAALVGGQPDMSIVGQASNGREAIQQFQMAYRRRPFPAASPGRNVLPFGQVCEAS